MKNWFVDKLEIAHGGHTPLRSMEGLRGIAVFLVFLVHYSGLVSPWLLKDSDIVHVKDFIATMGHVGVDLFFVLSGFLIYGTVIKNNAFSFLKYFRRRVARIYPTFLTVLFLYLCLSYLFPSNSKLPIGSLENIIYIVQNVFLLPGIFDIEPIVTVSWSLSYEFFYYLFVPLFIAILKLKCWNSNKRIMLWFAIFISGIIIYFFYDYPVRLLMFVPGIILFELIFFKKIIYNLGGGIFCLFFALLVFGTKSIYDFNYGFALFIISFLFFILCLDSFTPNTFSEKWLSFTPLRWLGNMSYSYYLIHGLTLKFLFMLFTNIYVPNNQNVMLFTWLWIPFFLLTLITSFFLFIFVERPFSLAKKKSLH